MTWSSDEQAVRKVVTDFVEAINQLDMESLGALFTEDADFVVITGNHLKGREEITTYHSGLLGRSFKGSHLDVTSATVRFLRPDVAIARVGTKRTDDDGTEMRTSCPMFVLVRERQEWLIAAAQNTLTSGPPVPPIGKAMA